MMKGKYKRKSSDIHARHTTSSNAGTIQELRGTQAELVWRLLGPGPTPGDSDVLPIIP